MRTFTLDGLLGRPPACHPRLDAGRELIGRRLGARFVVAAFAAALLSGCSLIPSTGTSATGSAPSTINASTQASEESSSISPTSSAPQILTTTPSPLLTDVVSEDQAEFASPSGNILCLFDGKTDHTPYVRCTVIARTWTPPPKPSNCDLDWGNDLELADTASIACAGDSILGAIQFKSASPPSWFRPSTDSVVNVGARDDTPTATLSYGRTLVYGDLFCSSDRKGVTCSNIATHAPVMLARATFSTTPPTAIGTPAGALAGSWLGHGRALDITSDGVVTIEYRANSLCSDDPTPPCDVTDGNTLRYGGLVILRVATASTSASPPVIARADVVISTDPAFVVGSSQELALVSGVVGWGGMTFCGPDAEPFACGA